MADERRYQEDEVAEIFRAASQPRDAGAPSLSDDDPSYRAAGMTLAEIQEIGRDVGIEPARIADAAGRLGQRPVAQPRFIHLGMPVGVGRSIDLPRAPTQEEWEELVGELRETFRAHGRLEGMGTNLKSWSNSNLRAYVEPSETGYRLRLRTVKGNALLLNRLGGLMAGVGTIALATGLLFSRTNSELFPTLFITSMGALALAYNALRLPAWARKREEQMEYIANTAHAIVRDD